MTEKQLLECVRDACRWQHLAVYHTHDSRRSEAGFPDLVIVGPGGVLFRELKTEAGRLTPAQTLWLDRLTAAGADAAVWRPSDWPERVLTELANVARHPATTNQGATP